MDRKTHIENLLQKYLDKSLDASELEELNAIFSNHQPDDVVKAWLYHQWDVTESGTHDYQPDDLFQKISDKVGIQPSDLDNDEIKMRFLLHKRNALSKVLLPALKYAAIFIIAFLLATFYNKSKPDSKPFVAYNGSTVNEIEIPKGSKTKLTLSDGTRVWLNSESKLIYPNHFNNQVREVFIEGEGYFDVAEDTAKPFIVQTSDIEIKVTGTEFNVKSYPGDDRIETTLISGSVVIGEKKSSFLAQKKNIELKPKEKAVFLKTGRDLQTQRTIYKKRVPVSTKIAIEKNIEPDDLISWKENKLIFTKEKFKAIIPRLERWYNIKIDLKYEAMENFTYSGSFEGETVEQALNALKITTSFDYQINKNKVTITKPKN